MLLNLSNHPSASWPENQIEAAVTLFGGVGDMPFPNIEPHLDTDGVRQLVEAYYQKILQAKPQGVHLMGELVFCAQLAVKLHQAGVPVVASTTNREVVYLPDGSKVSKFTFIRFRMYF